LLIITIGPHIVDLLGPSAGRKDLEVTLEKIFGIHKIRKVVGAVGILVIDIFELLACFKERHDIFIDLLGLDVIFFCKELLCPTKLV
jgi:hypothetical protein